MPISAPDGRDDGCGTSEPDLSDEAVAEVMAKELALLAPDIRSDPAAVSGLLHEAFREFGASGRTWDRSQIIKALAGELGSATAEAEEMRGFRLGQDTILLTYRARRPDRVSLRSSLWVHGAAGWQLFFHQGTPLPDR